MPDWLAQLMDLCPPALAWEPRRRWLILQRWPDAAVRAAEQDARLGKPEALALYDSEVSAIKAAIPKD